MCRERVRRYRRVCTGITCSRRSRGKTQPANLSWLCHVRATEGIRALWANPLDATPVNCKKYEVSLHTFFAEANCARMDFPANTVAARDKKAGGPRVCLDPPVFNLRCSAGRCLRSRIAYHSDRDIRVGDGRRPACVVDHVQDAALPDTRIQEDRQQIMET